MSGYWNEYGNMKYVVFISLFHRYYSGEKTAPILTIFIGGNHEASNYLCELPYGGWVCPNIYYMGELYELGCFVVHCTVEAV